MENTNMNEGKRFLVIGIIIAAAILVFTAVFLHFSSKEMAELEDQLAQLKSDYKSAIEETNQYTTSIETEDIAAVIKEIQTKGNEVASIQNEMIKHDLKYHNPMDAPNEETRIDKKTREKLKSLFAKDVDVSMESPWFVGTDLKCVFNPIFQYKGGNIPVIWVFESDGRVAALAVAEYNPTKGVFEELSLYNTMFGSEVAQEAYDVMVERVTGKKPGSDEFEGLDIVDESDEPEGTMLLDDDGEDTAPETNNDQDTSNSTGNEEGN